MKKAWIVLIVLFFLSSCITSLANYQSNTVETRKMNSQELSHSDNHLTGFMIVDDHGSILSNIPADWRIEHQNGWAVGSGKTDSNGILLIKSDKISQYPITLHLNIPKTHTYVPYSKSYHIEDDSQHKITLLKEKLIKLEIHFLDEDGKKPLNIGSISYRIIDRDRQEARKIGTGSIRNGFFSTDFYILESETPEQGFTLEFEVSFNLDNIEVEKSMVIKDEQFNVVDISGKMLYSVKIPLKLYNKFIYPMEFKEVNSVNGTSLENDGKYELYYHFEMNNRIISDDEVINIYRPEETIYFEYPVQDESSIPELVYSLKYPYKETELSTEGRIKGYKDSTNIASDLSPYTVVIDTDPHTIHSYQITVFNPFGEPVQNAEVEGLFSVGEEKQILSEITNEEGKAFFSIKVPLQLNSYLRKNFHSDASFFIGKENFYSNTATNRSSWGSTHAYGSKEVEESFVILESPDHYFKGTDFQVSVSDGLRNIITYIRNNSDNLNSSLTFPAFQRSVYKDSEWLQIKLKSTIVFNSLQLSKFKIGSRLFIETIQPLTLQIQDYLSGIIPTRYSGYDIFITSYTKDFSEKSALNKEVSFRFLFNKETFILFTDQLITSQELLNRSVILIDDFRSEIQLD